MAGGLNTCSPLVRTPWAPLQWHSMQKATAAKLGPISILLVVSHGARVATAYYIKAAAHTPYKQRTKS